LPAEEEAEVAMAQGAPCVREIVIWCRRLAWGAQFFL
jgi:hypothetical protein